MGFPFTALGWIISEEKLKLRISKKHLLFATTLVALLFVAEIVTVTVHGDVKNNRNHGIPLSAAVSSVSDLSCLSA